MHLKLIEFWELEPHLIRVGVNHFHLQIIVLQRPQTYPDGALVGAHEETPQLAADNELVDDAIRDLELSDQLLAFVPVEHQLLLIGAAYKNIGFHYDVLGFARLLVELDTVVDGPFLMLKRFQNVLGVLLHVPAKHVAVHAGWHHIQIVVWNRNVFDQGGVSVQDLDGFVVDGVVDYHVALLVRHQIVSPIRVFQNLAVVQPHLLQRVETLAQNCEDLKPVWESHCQEHSQRVDRHWKRLFLKILRNQSFFLDVLRLEIVPHLHRIILRTGHEDLFGDGNWNVVDFFIVEPRWKKGLNRRYFSIQLIRV